MSNLNSLFYNFKEAKFNPITITHSILFAATVTYWRVLKNLLRFGPPSLRKHVAETYHGKVVHLDDAKKFVTINKEIDLRNLDQVLPFKHAKDIILKNPQNIVAYECACRAQKKDPCGPTDVCLVIGEPFSDLVRMFQPFRSRRITPDEALQIMQEEDDRGHIHTAWFKTAMLDRFYAICNCCSCCCLGMKLRNELGMKNLLPSGHRAKIGEDCVGCGKCGENCQFDAIEILEFSDNGKKRKKASVIVEKCFGCGVCETKCEKEAISLVLDPAKGVPLNIEDLSAMSEQRI
jgi:ferredoxin